MSNVYPGFWGKLFFIHFSILNIFFLTWIPWVLQKWWSTFFVGTPALLGAHIFSEDFGPPFCAQPEVGQHIEGATNVGTQGLRRGKVQ